MPKQRRYLGNPQFQHLHIDEDAEEQRDTKELCRHHDATTASPGYHVEGEAQPLELDGRVLTEDRDVGSEEDEDLPAGTTGRARGGRRNGDEAYEQNEPFQRLGGRQRSGSGSPSTSRRSLTAVLAPPRELRVRLTKNLSTRMHAIRRFVDFTICNSDSRQPMFKIVKDEQDVYRLRHGDYLLRCRLTFNTKRNKDDPYVKDYLAEIKFRGRLFKYNEEKVSFEELGVVSQCMAICLVASCWRSPINPLLASSY